MQQDLNQRVTHRPIFNTKKVIEHYEEKDGIPIRYVCTSALNMGSAKADIFYRETPHPEFGNRYFGLYINPYACGESDGSVIMITNADNIESLDFTMVDIDGKLYYSQHRHDFYNITDEIAIDGGRAYFKYIGPVKTTVNLKVKDGNFIYGV